MDMRGCGGLIRKTFAQRRYGIYKGLLLGTRKRENCQEGE